MSDSTSSQAAPDPNLGTVLAGRYRITEALGSGGMGVVYRAEHVHMKKAVAVKILHQHMTVVPEVVARFEREAVAAARIEHGNVAAATDFGRLEDGSFYLVLEYIDGRSLSSLLEGGAALPTLRALVIARQIADGLAAAHAAGIVHRDLKPDNVMLIEREGMFDWVKMLDFGIAQVHFEEESQKLTQVGTIFGTPQYMSPEQGQGNPVDARSDLYALGVILYEMLAGRLPFVATDMVVLITRHITEAPPPLPAGIHPAVVELVGELLEKDPAQRIQSAAELVRIVDRLLANPEIAPVGSIPPNAFSTAPPPGHSAASAPTALGIQMRLPPLDVVRRKLRGARKRLERPIRIGGQPIPLYAILAAALVAFLPPLVLWWAQSGKASARADAAHEGLQTDDAKKRAGVASEAEQRRSLLVRAEAGDRPSLATLDALPASDKRAPEFRALAHGRCVLGELTACVAAYKAGILAAPTLKRDPVLLSDVRHMAESTLVYEEAMRLAAHHLDAAGLDVLWDVWTATRGRKDAQDVSRRARQFLDDGSVREHGGRELRAVLDLERAERRHRCKDARELVQKVADYGDERALPALDKLGVTRGCGVLSLGDCWSCLRGTQDLATAKSAAGARKGPTFR